VTSDIRLFQVLPEAERQALFGWGEDLFDVKRYGLQWRLKDWHFVLYEDGAPRANASVLRHEAEVGGQRTVIGGLGSVIALPEVRGRGLARQAVGRASEFLRDNVGASFGLLFCLPRLVPYYGAQGWRQLDQGVVIDQPDGKIPAPFPVMILPFADRPWPAEQVELGSLPW
jgi:GNAT superfamily N-acetyltransferase